MNSWVVIRLVACIEEHGDLHELIAQLVLIADSQVAALLRRRVMRCLVHRAFAVLVYYERSGLLLVLLVLGAIVLRRVRLNIKVAGRAGLRCAFHSLLYGIRVRACGHYLVPGVSVGLFAQLRS